MTPDPSSWTLMHIWRALKRLWAVIAVAVVLGAGAAYVHGARTTPLYQSTSTLAFSVSQGSTAADLANGSTYAQNQMLTFAQLATSSAVLEPVIEDLGLQTSVQELKQSIVVTIPQNTLILQIRVSARSGQRAADLANSIASSLTEVVLKVTPKPTTGESPNINATLVNQAVPPKVQASPDKPKETLLGAGAGFVVGLLVVLLRALTNPRITDEYELEQISGGRVLGAVSRWRAADRPRSTEATPDATAEELRRVGSALVHAAAELSARRILIVSPNSGDGRTEMTCGLATTLAGLGYRVLIVDGDLHRPRIAENLGLDNGAGLTTILAEGTPTAVVVQSLPHGGPDVVVSGPAARSPSRLLASARMRAMLEDVQARYEIVLIDTPPGLSVADADLLAGMTDGAVVIVDSTRTRREAVGKVISNLEGSGGRVVGLVLNRMSPDRRASRRTMSGRR